MAAIAGRRYTTSADLSNIGRPNGPACSTGELLNTPQAL